MADTATAGSDNAVHDAHGRAKVPTRDDALRCISENIDGLQEFNLRSLFLFGSVARNEASLESDLDFLVEFEGAATLRRYMGLKFFLEDLFNRPVDLVTRRSLKSQISKTVLEDAIRVA